MDAFLLPCIFEIESYPIKFFIRIYYAAIENMKDSFYELRLLNKFVSLEYNTNLTTILQTT